jgi:tetratricopeptide (TPR) repeat protein
MPNFTDPRFRQLNEANRRAQAFLDKSEWAAAMEGFVQVRELADKLGFDGSWASWGIAICLDANGEYEMAYGNMLSALQVDPLNLGKQGSFDVIVGHIRASLADPARDAKDASTPRLYRLLVQSAEADGPAHLAMARHLSAAGDHAGAMHIIDAVTTLSPTWREGWERKALVARALGNAQLAVECEAEAATCCPANKPFGIPTSSVIC